MLISDAIANLIEQLLADNNGYAEIRRNDLADRLGCVPSQINYVISSRFTPELGYVIESRRGGGGYIRIIKKQLGRDEYLMHFFCAIGEQIDEQAAAAFIANLSADSLISAREAHIMKSALSSASLMSVSPDRRDTVRADIMKQIILALMK
ncbi:MAG: CtsR family transcriptional regulator [Ruminococcaceae bacterium]|nr:CtsR family transcriptional regulator [Oscillospiraceae bacterium]